MALDTRLERLLSQAVQAGGDQAAIEPGLADSLVRQTRSVVEQLEKSGQTPVLLVSAPLRWLLSRFLRRVVPQLVVLSHPEIPESKQIRVINLIGGQA